jgi:hypothetical protein
MLVVLACAACATEEDVAERAATSSPEAAAVTGQPLPGDEALTPPPPDPEGGDHVDQLATVSDGTLAADLELTVSGLTGFAEPVTGTCAAMATGPTLDMRLSDGSTLSLAFDGDGGSLVLAAPGIEVRQTLDAVDLSVSGTSVSLGADLLTEGTSERSGRLSLDGTCS